MNDPNRPKDIIDHIEALAAAHGHFEPVDENYYQAFGGLEPAADRKARHRLMLGPGEGSPPARRQQDRPCCRGARFKICAEYVHRRQPRFCPLRCVWQFRLFARIGFEPTVEMDEIMAEKFKLVEPMITNIVRRTLPWLLSREVSQSQLPL